MIPTHFIDVLEAHAAGIGGNTALDFLADGRETGASATYAQLYLRACALGAALQRRSGAGARVMLMLPSGMDYVDGFLACQFGGQVAVPLFPPKSRRPRHLDRVRHVVADAQPQMLLCEAAMQPVLRELVQALGIAAEVLTVAELAQDGPGPGAWRRPAADGATVSFLQYTSGSTGTPKGVVVRQRNLLANLALMRTVLGLDPSDVMVNWLPLYHDMGLIGGLLEPLFTGARCVLMDTRHFVQSPGLWPQAMSRHRGTACFAPDFAYALCADSVDDATIAGLDLGCWRHAINGAEPVHQATLERFAARFAPAGFRATSLRPGYGQAEATLCATGYREGQAPVTLRVDPAALQAGRAAVAAAGAPAQLLVGAGYPQDRHRVAIVDPRTLHHRAPGEVGEVWLHGPSNAEEYWGKPELSAATFRARAHGDERDYLRSGDLGFLHEGQLFICGRLKDVLIVNGRNLYPNDLEFAVSQEHDAVRPGRLAAFAVPGAPGQREQLVLVAEVSRRFTDPAAQATLFAGIRATLREAADCPLDSIVLVAGATIPMTTSGKISRSATRQAFLADTLEVVARSDDGGAGALPSLPALNALATADAAPRAMLDACTGFLCRHVAALRPDAPPAPDVTLLALGLDSMALATLHGRLRAQCGWQPPLAQLFGGATLADLAAALLRHLQSAAPAASVIAPAAAGLARQSHAQRRLWFLNRLDPHDCQHNIAIQLRLSGHLDTETLRRSLRVLALRHTALHTGLRNTADGPMQERMPQALPELAREDLAALPPAAQQERIAQLLHQQRTLPFDLEAGAVLRASVASLGDTEHVLTLGVHHIAFDGQSARILLADLDRLMRSGGVDGAPAPLAYADFAEWEHARLAHGARDVALAFWRDHLDRYPHTLALAPQPEAREGKGRLAFTLPASQLAQLERYCRGAGMTPFMALLSLFALCLHHASGQERFIVGTDVAGRYHPQLDDVVGFFVNQLPLRCNLEGAPTLAELFARQAAAARQAYAHQDLPFDVLVGALAPQRSSSQTPLFQAKLNWQAQPGVDSIGALRVAGIEQAQDAGAFAVVLDLAHGPAGVQAVLKYQQRTFDDSAAERFAQLWAGLVEGFEGMLDHPLPAIGARLHEQDRALRQAFLQRQAADGRARLGQARRRAVQA